MKELIAKRQAALKAEGKKGFTLIEVIVVLVILAILAAIAIPALTGYIDKANQRAVVTEAAQIRTGLQAISSDSYTTGAGAMTITAGADNLPTGYSPVVTGTTTVQQEIRNLSGTTVPADGTLTAIQWSGRNLIGFTYNTGTNGYTVVYSATGYQVTKN
jgi:type IV pilus assembly protein PilA